MKLFAGRGWGRSLRPLFIWAALALLRAALLGVAFFGATQLENVAAQERGADDGVTTKVLSLEQLWNQAEVAKDTHSLSQLLADKFFYVDIDGSLIKDKAEFLTSVTNRAEHIESIRGESMMSQVHGDTVIVTGVYHEKGTLNGKPYYHHGRFTDTWVKEGSAWLCAASQSTLIQK
jgi:ketosteroid isomerase-like protein